MKVSARAWVDAPPERVFDFVADMHNDPLWVTTVQDVEQIKGGCPGRGAKYRYRQVLGPRTVDMEATVTVYDRPTELHWHMEHAAMDYESTMRFTAKRGGTKIRQTNVETWHFAPWWLRLWAPAMIRRQMRHQFHLLEKALEGEEEEASVQD